jgi:lipoprotein-releasing system permease protein
MDNVLPAGIFVLQEDVEKDYVVVPMELMRNLLQYTNEVSAIEIFTDPKSDQESLKQEIGDVLGDKFIVKDRREQNEAVFKIFKSEKLATYLILLFILIVASFNMIGALTMLVIEKKKDILVLKAMGFTYRQIRSVFLYEGLLLALIGGAVGLIIGVGVCLLQQEIGFIPLENSVVAYYPVKVIWQDVLLVWMTIVVLGLLSSFWPAYNSVKTDDVKLS